MSQLRRLANVDQHVTVSELKAGINDILREKGYDMSSLYQEMEMDSLFIDTHDDRSTTADTVQLHSHLFYEILYCRSSGLEYLLGTRRYQVQKGDVIYIPPAISHRPLFLDKLPEPYSRYVIWISADYAAGLKKISRMQNFCRMSRSSCAPWARTGRTWAFCSGTASRNHWQAAQDGRQRCAEIRSSFWYT